MTPLMYSNNAEVKYPLSSFHEAAIPNDILIGMTLHIDAGLDPVLSVLQVLPGFAYLAIEDSVSHELIASVAVSSPVSAIIYPMEMSQGSYGAVSFGPGITSAFNSGHVSVALDPDVVTYRRTPGPVWSLNVNGQAYALTDLLKLVAGSSYLTLTAEGSTIYFDRHDSAIPADTLRRFTEVAGLSSEPVLTIGGVRPDAAGNIQFSFQSSDTFPDCPDVYSLKPKRATEGYDEATELPLDVLVPREYSDNYECTPEQPDPPEPPLDGDQYLFVVNIKDIADDTEVGVVITDSESPIVPGAILDGGYPDTAADDYVSIIDALHPETPDSTYLDTLDGNDND